MRPAAPGRRHRAGTLGTSRDRQLTLAGQEFGQQVWPVEDEASSPDVPRKQAGGQRLEVSLPAARFWAQLRILRLIYKKSEEEAERHISQKLSIVMPVSTSSTTAESSRIRGRILKSVVQLLTWRGLQPLK